MLNTSTYDRSVAAAQLVEAACCAQEGDSESAKFHIRRALAQIDGFQVSHVSNTCLPQRERPSIPRGGLAHWQVRRVAAFVDACLAVSGGRLVRRRVSGVDRAALFWKSAAPPGYPQCTTLTGAVKRYPSPRSVRMSIGCEGSASILRRNRRICTSIERS